MKVPEPRKLSSGNWFIQMRLNGVSVPVTASSRKECIRQAELIKAEHRAGKRTIEQKTSITLGEAIDSYIKSRKEVLSPSTIIGYQDIRKNRFQNYMDKPIENIDWQEAVNNEGKSPKTIKNAMGLIRSVYKANNILAPEVRLPAPVRSEHPWLSPEETTRFVELVKGQKCEIPALLALHSLRKSEVCGLEWSDIDLKAGVIHVNGALLLTETGEWVKRKQNKTLYSSRTVPIFIPALKSALENVEDKSGPVINVHPETPYRQIQDICKKNGLPLVGWHGLRHSFASLCYSKGINELTCMQLGGWSDYQTMRKIYTHLSENDKKSAVDILTSFFNSSANNANKNANDEKKC